MSNSNSKLISLIRPIYNRTIRPLTPRKEIPISNVPGDATGIGRMLDISDSIEIKPNAIQQIRKYVDLGDSVVEVATGEGFFAAVCLTEGAYVQTFEPQQSRIDRAKNYHHKLGFTDNIEYNHALIESTHKNFPGISAAEELSARVLPSADVLLLDCEGAELDILKQLESSYDRILVECHSDLGANPERITHLLTGSGYEVVESVPVGKLRKKKRFLTAVGSNKD